MKKTVSHNRFMVARIFCILYLIVAIVSISAEFVKSYASIIVEQQIPAADFDYSSNTSEKQLPEDGNLENSSICYDQEDTTEYLYLDNHFVDKKSVVLFSTKLFFGYSIKNNFEHYSEILIPPPQS
jgi:hypothetical protein